jgi:hypothetical protein
LFTPNCATAHQTPEYQVEHSNDPNRHVQDLPTKTYHPRDSNPLPDGDDIAASSNHYAIARGDGTYVNTFLHADWSDWPPLYTLLYLNGKMQHKNKKRYAERCNAASLNFMACAFETTGAICMQVTPLIDRIARNTAELSDITFVLQKWNGHSIAMKLDAVV